MQPVPKADDAFCIAVLGDFLGDQSWLPGVSGATWEPRRATPDTMLGLTGLRPRVRVSLTEGEESAELEFDALDGFNPQGLFLRSSLFARFRDAREAAVEGRVDSDPAPEDGQGGGDPSSAGSGEGEGLNLLEMILDQEPTPEEGALPRTREELDSFVRQVVRPHLVRPDVDRPSRIAAVDQEASERMSDLIHAEPFQKLEGLWRSVVVLLSKIDTFGKVRVYLVHLPKEELERDLLDGDDPRRSKLHQLLSAPDLGAPGRRWAVVAGAYGFQFAPSDLDLLGRIGQVAKAADVPWISSINPESVESRGTGEGGTETSFQDPPEEWNRLRERPEMAWLGLTYPRFLVREPIGGSSGRSRAFDFQERSDSMRDLLWGDGAFVCAALFAQGYASEGLGFRAENRLELGGMPLGECRGESGASPTSVGVRLTLPMAEELTGLGVIPLLGFPERAGIRVGGFHSLSAAGASLEAWWRR